MQHRGSLVFGKNHFYGMKGAEVGIHKDTEYSGIEKMVLWG